ncbi:sulfotransferase family protein [Streptosporangium sp. CA-135522]|uniref:sulfotransferase family protein n=1 Tax=Streptosporangium sp. CA-135522 TaxID=3240072 RepID=UPI003D91D4CE
MLEVIGAGFPRTGTTSLKAALDRLGFGPCHHMFEVLSRPGQAERWLPVLSDGPTDWEQVLDGYRSAVDWPAGYFWRELTEAYPDAKVILTVRDAHRWYASFRTLMSGPRAILEATDEVPPMMEPMMRFRPVMDMMGRSTFGDTWRFGENLPDEEHAVEAFRRHVATVQESLPADRLLVFEASQGWDPLCDFLGVERPEGEAFPHLNDSEWLRRNFERSMRGDHMISPFDAAP